MNESLTIILSTKIYSEKIIRGLNLLLKDDINSLYKKNSDFILEFKTEDGLIKYLRELNNRESQNNIFSKNKNIIELIFTYSIYNSINKKSEKI
jgi:hypothetical protein